MLIIPNRNIYDLSSIRQIKLIYMDNQPSKKLDKCDTDEDQQQLVCIIPSTQNQAQLPRAQNQENKKYLFKMSKVAQPELQLAFSLLKEHGITQSKLGLNSEFEKSLLQTDWQSAKCEVKIGNLKGYLTTLRLNLSYRQFYSYKIDGGQFGYLYAYFVKNKQYAAKVVKIRQENQRQNYIFSALRQIFLTKIASALKIGPEFSSLFGYDALVFRDGIQFVMEMCETQQSIFYRRKGQIQSDLLCSLKLFHSFQICHQDIKLDNNAWSPCFGKFVFIDFGLSRFIAEPIGIKSRTKFVGNFGYASPQMRKLYYFRQDGQVDLYYNDLFGLQKVINQVAANSQNEHPNVSYQLDVPEVVSKFCQKDQLLHIYASFKYFLFLKDYQSVKQMISNPQKSLIFTFRQLLNIHNNFKNGNSLQPKITSQKQDFQQKIDEQDTFFLNYTIRIKDSGGFISSFSKLAEVANSSNHSLFFSSFWLNDLQMTNIFIFLDVYSGNQLSLSDKRKSLINKIYVKIDEGQNHTSSTLKFRAVLINLFKYFMSTQNMEIMQQIQSYFVLFDDLQKQDEMELSILKLERTRNNQIKEYVLKNLEYFIGKIMVHTNNYFEQSRNKENLQGILLQDIPVDSVDFIKQTITLMESFESSFRLTYFQKSCCNFQFYQQYLLKYQKLLNKDVQYFISHCLSCYRKGSYKLIPLSSTIPIYQSQYLKNCLVKSNIIFSFKSSKLEPIKDIMKTEPFLSQYATVLHVFQPSVSDHKKKQIFKDCMSITSQNIFILSQYTYCMFKIYLQIAEISRSMANYVRNLKINKIKKVKDVVFIGSSLYQVLRFCPDSGLNQLKTCKKSFQIFILFAHQFFVLISWILKLIYLNQEQQDKTIDINPFFLASSEQCQNLPVNIQSISLHLSKANAKDLSPCLKKELYLLFLMGSSYVLWLKKSHAEAIQRLIYCSSYGQELARYFCVRMLCSIFQEAKLSDQRLIEEAVLQFFKIEYQKNKGFSSYKMNQKVMCIVLKKFIHKYASEDSALFLISVSRQLYQRRQNVTTSGFLDAVQSYVIICSGEQALLILKIHILNQDLSSFNKNPIILIMFFYLFLKAKNHLQYAEKLKLIKLCVFYVNFFGEGSFQYYKTKLRCEAQQLFLNKRVRKPKFSRFKYSFKIFLAEFKKITMKKNSQIFNFTMQRIEYKLRKIKKNLMCYDFIVN